MKRRNQTKLQRYQSSVTFIQSYVFSRCKSLKNINLPNITVITDSILSSCYSLTEIEIPTSVMSIEQYDFCECKSLVKI